MPEIWFTADTHFGHANIIRHCARPFETVEEMDAALIDLWNSRVGPNDEIYHLGDFAFKADPDRVEKLFRRLRGKKHLIIGNHDGAATLRLPWASEPVDRRIVRVPGVDVPVVLDHYAMRVWPRSHHGAIHLYGHSHGTLPGHGRSIDVGVDVHGYRPVELAEIRPLLHEQQEQLERDLEMLRRFKEMRGRGDVEVALRILDGAPAETES